MLIAVEPNVRLFVDVEGSGLVRDAGAWRPTPTLVLVHGGPGSDHTVFRPAMTPLAGSMQLVYFDQRANGRSDHGAPSGWTLDVWARDLLALCDALGLRLPMILGYSFGAFVALRAALDRPLTLGGLILMNAAARVAPQRIGRGFERVAGPEAGAAALDFWTDASPATLKEYARRCIPHYVASDAARAVLAGTVRNVPLTLGFCQRGGEAHRIDLLPELGSLRLPTLVIAGEDDPITTVEDATDLVAALPSGLAQMIVVPGARHAAHLEGGERVIDAVRQFVLACHTSPDPERR